MGSFYRCNLIYQIIPKLQPGQLDGIVRFDIRDIYHIRRNPLFFDFIPQFLHKVTELAVASFQFLFRLCAFHLVGVQRLDVVNDHIFRDLIHRN